MRLLLASFGLVLISNSLFATPSGLNNIPTADTVPQGTFVLQAFSTVGSERDEDFNLGFKTGLETSLVRFEFGGIYHVWPGESGPFLGHAKAALPFGEGCQPWRWERSRHFPPAIARRMSSATRS